MSALRASGRRPDELRSLTIQPRFLTTAPGSVLIQAGTTMLLCTAAVEDSLPPWMKKDVTRGWLTAEYNMLPGSTSPRKPRERSKVDGRTTEIQRLIGRSLRAVIDFEALGPRTITIDCDVLQADGGTRTLAITGGYLAAALAVRAHAELRAASRPVLVDSIAAISCGIVDGQSLLDLDYSEDHRAEVDFNVVMTGSGQLVEVQGTAEGQPFSREKLNELLDLAQGGIETLTRRQQTLLAELARE